MVHQPTASHDPMTPKEFGSLMFQHCFILLAKCDLEILFILEFGQENVTNKAIRDTTKNMFH